MSYDLTLVKPTKEKVLIRLEEPDKEYGGFIIPEMYLTNGNYGTVIAAGPKCHEVKPGDFVIFGDYDKDDKQEQNGHTYIWIWEKDIMVAVEEVE